MLPQLSVEVVSLSSVGRETHVGKATVALFEAIQIFNSFVPFAVQLTHFDRTGAQAAGHLPSMILSSASHTLRGTGSPLEEKGQARMCGKLVASSLALFQLEQRNAEGVNPQFQIPPSPREKLAGTVNIILSYFSFESVSEQQPLHEPFLSISVGGHSLETERFPLASLPRVLPLFHANRVPLPIRIPAAAASGTRYDFRKTFCVQVELEVFRQNLTVTK